MTTSLSTADRTFFETEGYLILKGFYDVANDIILIQRDIYDTVGLVAEHQGVVLNRPDFPSRTDDTEQLGTFWGSIKSRITAIEASAGANLPLAILVGLYPRNARRIIEDIPSLQMPSHRFDFLS